MGASLLGVLLPILFTYTTFNTRTTARIQSMLQTARTFGSGVVLATTFVHIMPSAMTSLSNSRLPSIFQAEGYTGWAGLIAMLATMVLHLLEFIATQRCFQREVHRPRRMVKRRRLRSSATLSTLPPTSTPGLGLFASNLPPPSCPSQIHKNPALVGATPIPIENMSNESDVAYIMSSIAKGECDSFEDERRNPYFTFNTKEYNMDGFHYGSRSAAKRIHGLVDGNDDDTPYMHLGHAHGGDIILFNKKTQKETAEQEIAQEGWIEADLANSDRHQTQHMDMTASSVNVKENTQDAVSAKQGDARNLNDKPEAAVASERRFRAISTYFLEFGIALHSVIIGVTLGTTGSPKFKSLFVALLFHQFCEGIALGCRIAYLGLRRTSSKLWLLSAWFAMSTPLGMAIGIMIRLTYDTESIQFIIVRGVFDALSSGILLYTTMVHLITAEMTNNQSFRVSRLSHQIEQFLALWVGAAIMAVIAKWS
ncbi:high-affinity Zn(2+) transporter zrt1 [Podila epigama]|nr:high-affinity Zn(2+) transporter zrt1 [Podila epigama]